MIKRATGPSRKLHSEKEVSAQLYGDFRQEGSRGYLFLKNFFKDDLSKNELISLGSVYSKLINVILLRNYKRNKKLLIKWFDMNIDLIQSPSFKVIPVYEDEQESKEE